MSLNDKDVTLGANTAVDPYPGVANPTASSTHADPLAANFVTDPTTEALGAGAPNDFAGHKEVQRNFGKSAGVVEGRPGIIESTNIDPLNENSNKDDGWANAQSSRERLSSAGSSLGSAAQATYNTATSVVSGAASVVSGVGQSAYRRIVAGDEKARRSGKEGS